MSKGSEISETLLAVNLKKGDDKAFCQLYNSYSKKIKYFAFCYLKNSNDADEVVQDVFLKIWEKRQSLNTDLDINHFLFVIAKNKILDQLRKRTKEAGFVNHFMKNEKKLYFDTENEVNFNDLNNLYSKIVDNLPPQRKLIYKLNRFEGLTYKEIADKLNISIKTVENQVWQALKQIRKIIS